jgi:hypothetical protein
MHSHLFSSILKPSKVSARQSATTEAATMAKKGGKRQKPIVIAETGDQRAADEAATENAWRVSGDLHIIANRLGLGLLRGEVSPALAWVHKALLDLANASMDIEPYARAARSLVRYVAVREAHDREGLTWDNSWERAAEMLRRQPAAASAETMRAEYKKVRKALRAAGTSDDDPGYCWVDLPVPDKSS